MAAARADERKRIVEWLLKNSNLDYRNDVRRFLARRIKCGDHEEEQK